MSTITMSAGIFVYSIVDGEVWGGLVPAEGPTGPIGWWRTGDPAEAAKAAADLARDAG